MIFVSAGHNSKSTRIKRDPGAINKDGVKEGDLTIEFRDLVCIELDRLGAKYIKDSDEENLGMYLKRINTGTGSVVTEYHFDAAESPEATGATGIVEKKGESTAGDISLAKELVTSVADTLHIKSRGVITEEQSHRGSLGLMREDGLICLVELGFLTNPNDLGAYHNHKRELARKHAYILKKWDDLYI